MSSYRGNDRKIYDQEFVQSTKPIKWIETRTKEGEISLSHDGVAFGLIDDWIKSGHRFAVVTDSLLNAKVIEGYIGNRAKSSRVSSETPEVSREFLSKPDEYIEQNSIQTVIVTPTAQSGVDIQTSVDCGLALYSGVLPPLQLLQLIGRFRQCAEWWVSAPRHSANPTLPASLEPSKIKEWAAKLPSTFEAIGAATTKQTEGWGLWQSLSDQAWRAYSSEFAHLLLQEFFASVETVELPSSPQLWRQAIAEIKTADAERTLKADLVNGSRLLTAEKAPTTTAEGWDIKLATLESKYPKVVSRLLASPITEDSIDLTRLFSARRLDRLKNLGSVSRSRTRQTISISTPKRNSRRLITIRLTLSTFDSERSTRR